MRILLHSTIAADVARAITTHEVRTAEQEGCAGLDLQDTVTAAVDRAFDALIALAPRAAMGRGIHMPDTFRVVLLRAESGGPEHVLPHLSSALRSLELETDELPGKPIVVGRAEQMFVSSEDRPTEVQHIPIPDVVVGDHQARLRLELDRLLQSDASFVSLMAHTPDDGRGIAVWRTDGSVTMQEVVIGADPQRTAQLRSFYEERGHRAVQDYIADNGGHPTRMMAFDGPSDHKELLSLCIQVLRELHGVKANEPLLIRFDDHTQSETKSKPKRWIPFLLGLLVVGTVTGLYLVEGAVTTARLEDCVVEELKFASSRDPNQIRDNVWDCATTLGLTGRLEKSQLSVRVEGDEVTIEIQRGLLGSRTLSAPAPPVYEIHAFEIEHQPVIHLDMPPYEAGPELLWRIHNGVPIWERP